MLNESRETDRSNCMCVELYPDNDSHMKCYQMIRRVYDYASILHDKDIYDDDTENHQKGDSKKPHFHIVLYFKNKRILRAVAKELGIDSQFVQCARSPKAVTRYLIHKDDEEKFQYSEKVIDTNCEILVRKFLQDDVSNEEKAISVLACMESCESFAELISACIDCGCYDELRRMGNLAVQTFREIRAYSKAFKILNNEGDTSND